MPEFVGSPRVDAAAILESTGDLVFGSSSASVVALLLKRVLVRIARGEAIAIPQDILNKAIDVLIALEARIGVIDSELLFWEANRRALSRERERRWWRFGGSGQEHRARDRRLLALRRKSLDRDLAGLAHLLELVHLANLIEFARRPNVAAPAPLGLHGTRAGRSTAPTPLGSSTS